MTPTLTHKPGSLDAFLPQEQGLREHVRRVAALASAVVSAFVSDNGCQSGFSAEQVRAVEQAALLHHLQSEATGAPIAVRLLADLGFTSLPTESPSPIPSDAADIVRAFRGYTKTEDPALAELASILESANLLDEHIENLPYEDQNTAEVVNQLFDSEMLAPSFVRTLRGFSEGAIGRLRGAAARLPPFSRVAWEALRLAGEPDTGKGEVERALAKDAVLTGEMTLLANGSASFADGALPLIRLIAAAAVRSCYGSSEVREIWKHSLETGENAASLAAQSHLDPEEAYLAGLLHDVGRLPYETSIAAHAVHEWEDAGFPTVYAEMLATGTDHGEIGADILAGWNFPDPIVEAVRFHHRPELVKSKLAAILYAVEDCEESLPSMAREHVVASRLEVQALPRARAVGKGI